MGRYIEKQDDQELIDFHQSSLAGFDQSRVLEAERNLFAFYDDIEKELGRHQWLVGDEFSYADIAWFVTLFHEPARRRGQLPQLSQYPQLGGSYPATAFLQGRPLPGYSPGTRRWFA